jgi:hypothetical protein
MAHALRHLSGFLALAAALLAPALRAAEAPSVHFTVFAARPVQNLGFSPAPRATAEKIVFYPTARSPRYEFRGAMPIRFADPTSGAVVAEATIPPGIREALLLFVPLAPPAKSGLRYQIAVLDDSATRHAAGGPAIINLSGLALSGTIGSQAVTLTSGLNPTLPVGRSARIVLRVTMKNRSYQSYAETLQLGAKERALLILFPPFYRGSLEVQSRLLIDEPAGASPAPK